MSETVAHAGRPLRVLVTGGFGNIGSHAVRACLEAGYEVRVLDLPSKSAKRVAKDFDDNLSVIWGDVTTSDLAEAVSDRDVVIHTAFVLWPITEHNPDRARQVNVDGTERLLDACRQAPQPVRVVFTSSVAVFGHTQHLAPPRSMADELQATDVYSATKVEAETLVRNSGVPYVIARLGVAPPVRPGQMSSELIEQLFAIRPDNRVEFVHPADVGFALAAAAAAPAALERVLLIGGGAQARMTHLEFVNGLFRASGLGAMSAAAFGSADMYTDWLDTDESQQILGYQRGTFEGFIGDLRRQLGVRVYLVRLAAPLVRSVLVHRFARRGSNGPAET